VLVRDGVRRVVTGGDEQEAGAALWPLGAGRQFSSDRSAGIFTVVVTQPIRVRLLKRADLLPAQLQGAHHRRLRPGATGRACFTDGQAKARPVTVNMLGGFGAGALVSLPCFQDAGHQITHFCTIARLARCTQPRVSVAFTTIIPDGMTTCQPEGSSIRLYAYT